VHGDIPITARLKGKNNIGGVGRIKILIMYNSFRVVWVKISDPRSLSSQCIKENNESVTRVDSSVPLMPHQ